MEEIRHAAAVALAIVLEASPYLLLGSLLAAAVELYIPPGRLARWVPRGRLGAVGAGVAAGLILPTCECGVVPVVRRLLARGVPSGAAMAYLLAAPVINPVVILSTGAAYGWDPAMVGGRVGMVALTAGLLGVILAGRGRGEMLRPEAGRAGCADACGPAPEPDPPAPGARPGITALLARTAAEFSDMARFLILGAVAAGVIKTFLPGETLAVFADRPAASVAAMMLLAVVVSICSEADAFVAASLAGFPRAAQLAFMAVGPMVDLKLIPMFLAAFRRPVALWLVFGPLVAVFVLSLLVGPWLG